MPLHQIGLEWKYVRKAIAMLISLLELVNGTISFFLGLDVVDPL